jgi:hypothetical protein
MQIDDLEQQLQGFPLDELVTVDGESVYLRVQHDGAELGVHFMDAITDRQLHDAMQLGFQSALEFDAGWALADDGATLLLTRWLPDAQGWADVPEALEQLLNQAAQLRTLAAITIAGPDLGASRDERQMRARLMRREGR